MLLSKRQLPGGTPGTPELLSTRPSSSTSSNSSTGTAVPGSRIRGSERCARVSSPFGEFENAVLSIEETHRNRLPQKQISLPHLVQVVETSKLGKERRGWVTERGISPRSSRPLFP
eukprot:1316407-Rhodomonas_salina.1